MHLELIENKERDLSFLKENLLNEIELKTVNPSANFPFEEDYWQNFFQLQGRTCSYLFNDCNQTIGHVALREQPETRSVWLCWVLLKHEFRGRGIADKLLGYTEQIVMDRFGKEEYFLNVRKYNERAIHFYLKNGFEQISQGEENFQMKKVLKNS